MKKNEKNERRVVKTVDPSPELMPAPSQELMSTLLRPFLCCGLFLRLCLLFCAAARGSESETPLSAVTHARLMHLRAASPESGRAGIFKEEKEAEVGYKWNGIGTNLSCHH